MNQTKRNAVRAGQPYLYRKNGLPSEVFEIRLTEEVNAEAIAQATEETIQRYPYFKVRFEEEKGEFYPVENEAPFVARKTDALLPLGGKESNGYMLCVTYFENIIRISFHHGLADGRGIKFFMETLMYYYGKYAFGNESLVEGVRVNGEEIKPEEYVDPCAVKKSFDKTQIKKIDGLCKNAFTLPETKEEKKNHRRYEIAISQKEFMEACKKNNATPIILLSALMNKSIAGLYPDHDKPINSNFPVDVRDVVDAVGTYHNCVKSVSLPYGEKESGMSMESLCTYYRSLLRQQRQKDYCIKDFNMIPMLLGAVNSFHSFKAKQTMLSFLENVKLDTYMMSYVGQFQFGENETHVESVHLFSSCCDGLSLNITCQSGSFIIDFIQDFAGDAYVQGFKKELEKMGISYVCSEEILFETPTDTIPHTISEPVVKTYYDTMETGVVNGYKTVESFFVNSAEYTVDFMVDKLFRRNGETIEEAKERLQRNVQVTE